MAPTNAKATYAVTTLSLLTKVMETTSWFTSCPQLTLKASKAFPAKKVSFPVRCPYFHRWNRPADVVKDT